jgi:quercetin dioxygenase-like cupin family protein
MGQKPVTVQDITQIALQELRPGCAKGVLQEDARSQTGVFRVQPGGGVPAHLHSRTNDLFVGMAGEVEIRYEGQWGKGVFVLKPGTFCGMPPAADALTGAARLAVAGARGALAGLVYESSRHRAAPVRA